MFYWILKIIFSPIVGAIWVKKTTGKENIPTSGGYIVAANHLSFADAVLVGYAIPRWVHFLAGEKLYKNIFLATFMNLNGQIFVDRRLKKKKKEVIEQACDYLKKGSVVGIFPEGGRTRTGHMKTAYLGVARIALAAKVDILPLALTGQDEIMPVGQSMPKFKKTAQIEILPPFRYEDFKNLSEEEIVHEMLMPKIAEAIGDKYPKPDYVIKEIKSKMKE